MATKEQERAELHRIIWQIANDLRGSVDGWDFKSYVLGINIKTEDLAKINIPIPPLTSQEGIVQILDKFTQLESRRRQYEYYREKLLSFKEKSA